MRKSTEIVKSLIVFVLFFAVSSTVFAQETDPRLTIDVPYSLVQSWQSNTKITFPKNIADFNKQQVLALQYYLQSRTYELPTTGVFDNPTKEALLNHQGGTKVALTKETEKNINAFLSFLYCPVGQTDADNADYRLYNVNKKRLLPSNYIPNNLVIETKDEIMSAGPICAESETYEALKRMYTAAKLEGVNLYVTSSYRSEDSQDYLLQVMIRRMGNSAYRIVALPGQSEHNLGTAVDFAGFEGGKRIPLAAGKQIGWLQKNAAEFGFVNSYPTGKEAVTGFNPEPWHYRYVGAPISNTLETEGLTLSEFLDKHKDVINTQVGTYGDVARLWLREVIIGG